MSARLRVETSRASAKRARPSGQEFQNAIRGWNKRTPYGKEEKNRKRRQRKKHDDALEVEFTGATQLPSQHVEKKPLFFFDFVFRTTKNKAVDFEHDNRPKAPAESHVDGLFKIVRGNIGEPAIKIFNEP